jgi:NAD(P)H-hydrate epimerase
VRGARVAIVCGSGNNGGDGCVVARHLALAGCEVELFHTHAASELRGDAALARAMVERMRLPAFELRDQRDLARAAERWNAAAVLVDALLGTGSAGAPRERLAHVIDAFNAASAPLKVALDLPSGLDCDTGEAPGACVRADMTVTFVAEKLGFANPRAAPLLGRVVVAGIGAPT